MGHWALGTIQCMYLRNVCSHVQGLCAVFESILVNAEAGILLICEKFCMWYNYMFHTDDYFKACFCIKHCQPPICHLGLQDSRLTHHWTNNNPTLIVVVCADNTKRNTPKSLRCVQCRGTSNCPPLCLLSWCCMSAVKSVNIDTNVLSFV